MTVYHHKPHLKHSSGNQIEDGTTFPRGAEQTKTQGMIVPFYVPRLAPQLQEHSYIQKVRGRVAKKVQLDVSVRNCSTFLPNHKTDDLVSLLLLPSLTPQLTIL